MWSREQLKNKAKKALDINYWRIVLVSLIVAFVAGGGAYQSSYSTNIDLTDEIERLLEDSLDEGATFDDDFTYEDDFLYEDDFIDEIEAADIFAIVIILWIVILILVPIISIVSYGYTLLFTNPVDVGTKRFFIKSLSDKAEVKEVAYAFDHNYKNVIKVLFFKDIKIFLWSLLFIIPGIIKRYEYMMIPYLLAENPKLTKEEAFRLSRQMMNGQKLEAFILDWSFFGWDLLSAFTAGILSIFYVGPYKDLTYAALYEELSAVNGYPARAIAAQAEFVGTYMQAEVEQPVSEESEELNNTYDNVYSSPEE